MDRHFHSSLPFELTLDWGEETGASDNRLVKAVLEMGIMAFGA